MTTSDRATRLAQLVTVSRSRYQTAEDRVMDALRHAITTGALRPGERLRQDELAELLGVSRMPIRAALRHLESEGLVTFIAHRGAMVAALGAGEVGEIYELRALIESHAARRSVATVTDEDVEELAALLHEVESSGEGEHWIDARRAFYERFYSLGNGPRVVATIMRLRAEVGRYLLGLRVAESHSELLALVRSRDADGAAAYISRHLGEVAARLEMVRERNEALPEASSTR